MAAFQQSDVKWVSKNLLDGVPVEVLAVLNAIGPISTAVNTYIAASNIALAKIPPGIPIPVISPLFILANVILSEVQDLINTLRDTGAYLLLIPPREGGVKLIEQQMRLALLNQADANRPMFGSVTVRRGLPPTSAIGALGAFFNGPDKQTVLNLYNIVKGVFAFTSKVQNIALASADQVADDPARVVDEFFPLYQKQQIAGTARPVNVSPWVRIRLVDLIPGADEALGRASDFMNGILAWIPPDPNVQFLAFLQRQIQRTIDLITQITNVINNLNAAFQPIPVQAFAVTPFDGGTQELADATSQIFSPALNPDLIAVSPAAWSGGVILVFGGPTVPVVELSFSAFKSFLFLGL